MGRRRFDYFYIELCCALDLRLPRYALWLEFGEFGCDPERLERHALLSFFDSNLDRFLAHRGLHLRGRPRARLRRMLGRFDPAIATPSEVFARFAA